MRPLPLLAAALCAAISVAATSAPLAAQAGGRPPAPDDAAAPLPSVALPPELDRVLRDYERLWRAADAGALARLFAEDGFVLQSGRPPVRGRAAIERAYTGQAGGALRLRAVAHASADTVGYIVGVYGFGEDTTEQGKFTLTLRRARGGRWLIFSDMDNASVRPRRPGPSGGTTPSP